jgi:hypothetical protein
LLTAVILVVSFNYAEAFGPFCPKKRRSWRKWTLFAAVALGILVVSLPARVLMALGTITEPVASHTVYAVLVELESWFYKSSVMVYFFIIASMVFPTLEDRILGSGDIACSDRSVEKRQ